MVASRTMFNIGSILTGIGILLKRIGIMNLYIANVVNIAIMYVRISRIMKPVRIHLSQIQYHSYA
jgi:hypothetical protein